MKKRILFLLLTTINTVIYGMQTPEGSILTEKALYTPDIISHITEHLCYGPNYALKHVKNNIWSFSLTNTFFRNYFTQEKVQQNIIKLCSQCFNTNDSNTAYHLGCRTIDKKIDRFVDIALDKNKQFTELDLEDQWYLNTTALCMRNGADVSLLYITIQRRNFKAAHKIIEHAQKLNFHYNQPKNNLHLIVNMRHMLQSSIIDFPKNKIRYDELLTIAERLLQKNMLPDGRENNEEMTPLIHAILNEDEDLVRLLLKYGANPYIKYRRGGIIFEYTSETIGCWLKKIIKNSK